MNRMLFMTATFVMLCSISKAGLISVEPDSAPSGTILNNYFPGVSLSAYGDPGVLTNSNVFSLPDSFATTGSLVFASTGERPTGWGYATYRYLRADFAQGATLVSMDYAADDPSDANGFLRAFDASNNLVASASTGFVPLGSPTTLTVTAPNIAYITASWDDVLMLDRGVMDNMRFEPVSIPEPSALLFLALSGTIYCMSTGTRKRARRY